jgi:hypothetical protein
VPLPWRPVGPQVAAQRSHDIRQGGVWEQRGGLEHGVQGLANKILVVFTMKIHGEAVELGQNPGFHHEKMGGNMKKIVV